MNTLNVHIGNYMLFFSPKQLNYIIKKGDLQVLSAKQTGSKVDW